MSAMMVLRRPGTLSAVGLALSGAAIAGRPRQALKTVGLVAQGSRGIAETRAGLGGTFAALGTWALARGSSQAYTAVGVTWLGAAALRLAALRLDEPETDWTYWAYLAGEVTLGLAGLAARSRRSIRP